VIVSKEMFNSLVSCFHGQSLDNDNNFSYSVDVYVTVVVLRQLFFFLQVLFQEGSDEECHQAFQINQTPVFPLFGLLPSSFPGPSLCLTSLTTVCPKHKWEGPVAAGCR